jgi:hypothetical protein
LCAIIVSLMVVIIRLMPRALSSNMLMIATISATPRSFWAGFNACVGGVMT